MTDDELRNIPARAFVGLQPHDVFRWLKLTSDAVLDEAVIRTAHPDYRHWHEKIIAEQNRRVAVATLAATQGALEAARKAIPPHWKRDRNFIVSVIAAVAGVAATAVGWMAWRHPVSVPDPMPALRVPVTPAPTPAPQLTTPTPTPAPAPVSSEPKKTESMPDKPVSPDQEQTAPEPKS